MKFCYIILFLCLIGCADKYDNEDVRLNINLNLSPSEKQIAEITRVVVTVSGFNDESQDFEFKVDGRKATGIIAIPAGEEREITVHAYAGDKVEYEGQASIGQHKSGEQINLDIKLKPVAVEEYPVSQDGTLAIDFTEWKNGNMAPPWSVGFEFYVNKSVTVGALCVFDNWEFPGFAQDQQVGLWKGDGTLLASVFVTNNDPTTGGGAKSKWRFHNISPVVLNPDTNYIVASQGGEPMVYWPVSPVWDSRVIYIGNRIVNTGGKNDPLVFPKDKGPESCSKDNPCYFGANFLIVSK